MGLKLINNPSRRERKRKQPHTIFILTAGDGSYTMGSVKAKVLKTGDGSGVALIDVGTGDVVISVTDFNEVSGQRITSEVGLTPDQRRELIAKLQSFDQE